MAKRVIPIDMLWRGTDYVQGQIVEVSDEQFNKAIDAYLKSQEDAREDSSNSIDVPSQQEPEQQEPTTTSRRKSAAKDEQ